MLSWHRSMLFSLVHSPVPRLRRIVDIPLKYEGIRPIRIWLRILYCAQLRGNWHCTPMHRFPERQKPTKRRFFCFVMGAHSPLFLAIPCVGIFWRRFENPGSIYGRFLIIFDRSLHMANTDLILLSPHYFSHPLSFPFPPCLFSHVFHPWK